jgi:hypothetical protein
VAIRSLAEIITTTIAIGLVPARVTAFDREQTFRKEKLQSDEARDTHVEIADRAYAI